MFLRFTRFAKRFGPGIVTGASDDDPSGIATYSQAGALFGFGTLWMCVVTIPLMISVQEMAARISLVTGRGLIANMLKKYSRPLIASIMGLLIIANVVNLGADLGMMAASAQLLVPVPFFLLVIFFTLVTLGLQIFTTYGVYAQYLKWLAFSLLAYVIVGGIVHVNWSQAFSQTIFPSFQGSKDYWLMFVAILGTTISPYLYFWEANQTVEEEMMNHHLTSTRRKQSEKNLRQDMPAMRADVSIGMIASNVVAWFIMLTAAVVLHSAGITNITSADQAARVLAPLAGPFSSWIFALGIVGTGLLTIPILSGGIAYAVSEFFHQAEGLSKTWREAHVFYAVAVAATLVGLCMNVLGVNPVRALIASAVCNAVIAAPILFLILRMSNDKKMMGNHVNGVWSNVFGWITLIAMAGSSIAWVVATYF